VSQEGASSPRVGDPLGLEVDVDHAIAACGGDPRAAVRALIVLVDHLEEELRRRRDDVSRGYVRGRGGRNDDVPQTIDDAMDCSLETAPP
jgi:hypothetical protein